MINFHIDKFISSMSENAFLKRRNGSGIYQWAEKSLSIQIGCQVGCHYCWAREQMLRMKIIHSLEEWKSPRQKKTTLSLKKYAGVVMFPGTHNIDASNITHCISALRNLLSHENQVLITIKPTEEVTNFLCRELATYKKQIHFRFTIGSHNSKILASWEPGGACFEERIECLAKVRTDGFHGSVAAEPLLGGMETALYLIRAVAPYTEALWFGFMRRIKQRVLSGPSSIGSYVPLEVSMLQQLQTPLLAQQLMELQRFSWIYMKESIQQEAQKHVKSHY